MQFDPQVVAAFQRVHMDFREAAASIEAQVQQNIAMSKQVMNQEQVQPKQSQQDDVAKQAEALRQDIKNRLMNKNKQE